MQGRKRRPPFGATKKTSALYSKERALKNRIHELERELAVVTNDRQRAAEHNVRMGEEIRVYKARVDELASKQTASIGNLFTKAEVAKKLEEQYSRMLIGVLTALVSGKVTP